MTHAYVNGQGQRSLGSKVGVETDGQTDSGTTALPPVLRRSVRSDRNTTSKPRIINVHNSPKNN